jgi:hypothetical protein
MQCFGRADALRESDPQRRAAILQLDAFGIDADAAPLPAACADELAGMVRHGLRALRIELRHDLRLGREQRGRVGGFRQNVRRLEIDDAAEAGDQMRAGERDAVERKSANPANISASGWRAR